MALIQKVGCPPETIICFGPEEHWELFYVPLKLYPSIVLIALIISGILFSFFYFLNKKTSKYPLKKSLIYFLLIFFVVFVVEILIILYKNSMIVY